MYRDLVISDDQDFSDGWELISILLCYGNIIIILQVYLDEINTSSCLGFFKEIIVDGTIDGKVRYIHTVASLA